MASALEVATFADRLLRTADVPDYPNALNGLQVSTEAQVRKLAAAVDFSARTVGGARDTGADLLLVHHGAFWGGLATLTGTRYRIVASLFESGMGVYSSHLPLDCHPTIGNNALLAKELGLSPTSGFGRFNGVTIGAAGESGMPMKKLVSAARSFAEAHGGSIHVTPHPDARSVGRWAVCTGAGAGTDTLKEAAERGIDTLVVGEGPHWTAVYAEDNGLTIIYAGHYATETLGVQALAAEIAKEFGIAWEFIAAPTGT